MNKNKGFTLVELLAVIVILSVLMVIAIPAISGMMNEGKKKTFLMEADKVISNAKEQFIYDSSVGDFSEPGVYVYDINDDLEMNIGSTYQGYVVVDSTDEDNIKYYLYLSGAGYQINGDLVDETHSITNSSVKSKSDSFPTSTNDAKTYYATAQNEVKQNIVTQSQSILSAVKTQFATDSTTGDKQASGVYAYDINNDLNIDVPNDYQGYVVVDSTNSTVIKYYIYIKSGGYQINNVEVDSNSDITVTDVTSETNDFPTSKEEAKSDVEIVISNSTLVAGVYDSTGNLIADWNKLVSVYNLNVENTYTATTYKTNNESGNSMYYVLNNNTELSNVSKVILPDTISKIGYMAFNSANIKEIIFSDSVQSIETYGFYNCALLERVDLGNGLKTIGEYAFYKCGALKNINMGNSVTSISDQAFAHCSKLNNLVIPDSVLTIGTSAFAGCTNLSNLTLGNKIQTIKDYAFSRTSIGEINIPDSVTSLGQNVFWLCNNLITITIGAGIRQYGLNQGVFYDCNNLQNIYVSDNNSNYASVDGILFNKRKTDLVYYPVGRTTDNYNIPEGTQYVLSSAFSGSKLKSVSIPNSLEVIEIYAFKNCDSLTSATFSRTDHWYYGINKVNYGAGTSIDSSYFSNPSTAANTLKSTYSGVYLYYYINPYLQN